MAARPDDARAWHLHGHGHSGTFLGITRKVRVALAGRGPCWIAFSRLSSDRISICEIRHAMIKSWKSGVSSPPGKAAMPADNQKLIVLFGRTWTKGNCLGFHRTNKTLQKEKEADEKLTALAESENHFEADEEPKKPRRTSGRRSASAEHH